MTKDNSTEFESTGEARLPRRDRFILPLIGLLTISILLGSTEFLARQVYTRSNTAGEDCLVRQDPSTGPRGIPNCVSWEKIPEGKPTEYRFNSSGFRNDFDFGPKSPDIYRIVAIGTSDVGGFRVPQEQTFGALLPAKLSQLAGRKVELYNEGLPWRSPAMIAQHFNDALSVKPDLILWILSPMDLERTSWDVAPDPSHSLDLKTRAWLKIKAAFAAGSFTDSMAEIFGHTRTATMLKDLIYKSPSQYVKSYLLMTSDKTDYLKSESSAKWQEQLKEFSGSAAKIEDRGREAGVPVVALLLPDRTQVSMISMMGEWPKGYDPYKLDQELQSIVVSHGGTYIDLLSDFRAIPNPQLGYFAIDGHPNPQGHAAITDFLARRLTNGSVPALRTASQPQASLSSGN